MATASLDIQHYKPASEICLFKSTDQTPLPCIKYKLVERYLRAKFGLVFPLIFYGLWKFSLLNYQSILWSSTVPRKRGTEEKGGRGSLIHQGSRMKAWPPELLGNGRACLSQSSRVPALPQEGLRLWNWKPASNSWSHLCGMSMLCPRQCPKSSSSVFGEGAQGLLWLQLPQQAASPVGMVTESRKTSMVDGIHQCLLSWCRPRKMAFLISLTELISTEEEKPINNLSFSLNTHDKQLQKVYISKGLQKVSS